MLDGTTRALPEPIGFLLIPQFSMIAFSAALEPLRIANRVAGRDLYRWRLFSKDGGPVRSSNGIAVATDAAIGGAARQADFSTIMLCSGLGAERYSDPAVLQWLKRQARRGIEIGALCTGAHILARAGLLDGCRCTIHWENLAGFHEAFPEIDATADLYEIDRNRFTCSGGTAALDMMLHLISIAHGEELARSVSEQCLLDRIRGGHDHQRMPFGARFGRHHPRLARAVELIEVNLEEPLSLESLAEQVDLSRRQLERLFQKYLGRAPARFYLERRLERARQLLYQTDLPVMEIALASGFVSASHFTKCYGRLYGRTPRAERVGAPLEAPVADPPRVP